MLGAKRRGLPHQLYGLEVDEEAHHAAQHAVSRLGGPSLFRADFLSTLRGLQVPAVDVVVGNPPYLRYQTFNARNACFPGLAAAAAGVSLSRQASSWASFLVHAAGFVTPGGRLAHVVPGQILDAHYAQEVREFLAREFERVTVVAFEERVFPVAQEQVVLVCAEGKGNGPCRIELASTRRLDNLTSRRSFNGGSRREDAVPENSGALCSLNCFLRMSDASMHVAKGRATLGDWAPLQVSTSGPSLAQTAFSCSNTSKPLTSLSPTALQQ